MWTFLVPKQTSYFAQELLHLRALQVSLEKNPRQNAEIMEAQTIGEQIIAEAVKKAEMMKTQAEKDIDVWSRDLRRSST
jgi:hypothetical protein